MSDYDLAVIGSGPAGEKGAAQAAYFGKRVVLVERQPRLGGACVNTGTLPSKTLRETALYLGGFRQRALYGVSMSLAHDVTVPELMCRQEPVTSGEIARIHKNLDLHRVELLHGSARFLDEHTLAIDGKDARTISADVVLVATGSRPRRPPNIAFDGPGPRVVDDSDSILAIDRIPKRLIVLGAGVIGSEYASIFASLGVEVILLEGSGELLSFLDAELSALMTQRFRDMGIDVRFHAEVSAVERSGAGVRVTLGGGERLEADRMLVATGRIGNIEGLGLENIGAPPSPRGLIAVEPSFRIAGARGRVYAAGDVIGFPALASTAMEQARVAMCHAFDLGYKTRVSENLPYGLYTIPEAAMVGLSEEDAIAKGIDVTVGRARFGDCARGQIVGDLEGLLKLVFRSDDKRLIGVHILGERATELVHIGQMVMHYGGTIDDLVYEVWNFPTLAELFKLAAYNGLGNLARRKALEACR
jgi:NAD(P) transhydrogenase